MRRSSSPLTAAVMIPLACLVGLPLYYVVVNTFKTQPEMAASPLALPSAPTLENYRSVVEDVPLVQSFANTVYVTALSILVMLAVGATAAYGMVMRSSAFNRVFGAALLVAFLVPGQATLIPIYRLLVDLDLVDTLTGLVVFYSSGSIFCFFLVQGYLRTIPTEIIEAARIDGRVRSRSSGASCSPSSVRSWPRWVSSRPCGSGTTSSRPTSCSARRTRPRSCCRSTGPLGSSPRIGPPS